MDRNDLDFLAFACSVPWSGVLLGSADSLSLDDGSRRANHVYIDCPTPFLVAADSVDLATGEEVFFCTLIRDSVRIEAFLNGPNYPHNVPSVLPLDNLASSLSGDFLKAEKSYSIKRKLLISQVDKVTSIVPAFKAIVFSSPVGTLRIRADEDVPMSLVICPVQNCG
jgi:hypothetical protein